MQCRLFCEHQLPRPWPTPLGGRSTMAGGLFDGNGAFTKRSGDVLPESVGPQPVHFARMPWAMNRMLTA